jgi:hypothetical protein
MSLTDLATPLPTFPKPTIATFVFCIDPLAIFTPPLV